MTRVCNKCNVELPLDSFHNCKSFPLGKVYTCKVCSRQKSIQWNSDNKDRKKSNAKDHYLNNKDVYKKRSVEYAWAKKNPEKVRQCARRRYAADPSIYFKTVAMRRSRVRQATPQWLNSDQVRLMRDIYVRCSDITRLTGNKHHVDHIVPLKGNTVCGLHVPWNLRIIPAEINMSKGNSFTNYYEH